AVLAVEGEREEGTGRVVAPGRDLHATMVARRRARSGPLAPPRFGGEGRPAGGPGTPELRRAGDHELGGGARGRPPDAEPAPLRRRCERGCPAPARRARLAGGRGAPQPFP